jgi:Bacterial Ig-like domain (group 2)
MKRACVRAAVVFGVIVMTACSNTKEDLGSPTAPSPPSPATVRAVVVGGAAISGSTYQMTARADLTDGSTRDVTTQSQWATSSPEIATISATGVLTIARSGRIDVRATYQGVTGTMPLTVTAPAPGPLFILSGRVLETAPDQKPLGGVTLSIVGGPDNGATTTSAPNGQFGFVAVHGGTVTVNAQKDGYVVNQMAGIVLDRDREIEVVMFPTPPKNDSGATATARCNDRSWSWAQTRADACTANGGIAYAVCPGPLCSTVTTR